MEQKAKRPEKDHRAGYDRVTYWFRDTWHCINQKASEKMTHLMKGHTFWAAPGETCTMSAQMHLSGGSFYATLQLCFRSVHSTTRHLVQLPVTPPVQVCAEGYRFKSNSALRLLSLQTHLFGLLVSNQ